MQQVSKAVQQSILQVCKTGGVQAASLSRGPKSGEQNSYGESYKQRQTVRPRQRETETETDRQTCRKVLMEKCVCNDRWHTTCVWVYLTVYIYIYVCIRGSSDKLATIQRRLAWPLRKDDTHKNREVYQNISIRLSFCLSIFILISILLLARPIWLKLGSDG